VIVGIGTDIVKISRLSEHLVSKILSSSEIVQYESFSSPTRKQEYLAGRFAAKEAIIKAVSTFDGFCNMSDISINNDESGKPIVVYPKYENRKIHISISHEKDYAVAYCIFELL